MGPIKEENTTKMNKRLIVGLHDDEKRAAIETYLTANPDVKEIVYFYPTGMAPQDLSWTGLPVEYRTFWDVIRYVFDTPLHEKVDDSVLLIYDEMLRVRKRNDLSYNACHHIANQTSHVLLFQFLPIIDSLEDYMILVDFVFPWKYKLQSFDESFLRLPEVEIHSQDIQFDVEAIDITQDDRDKYTKTKEELFENLGRKSPETLPRNLQLFAGNLKKRAIRLDGFYLARNQRFKSKNAHVWTEYRLFDSMTQCAGSGLSPHQGEVVEGARTEEAWILDTPTSPVTLPDFLKASGAKKVTYVTTGLPVDEYYRGEAEKFFENLSTIYKEASA